MSLIDQVRSAVERATAGASLSAPPLNGLAIATRMVEALGEELERADAPPKAVRAALHTAMKVAHDEPRLEALAHLLTSEVERRWPDAAPAERSVLATRAMVLALQSGFDLETLPDELSQPQLSATRTSLLRRMGVFAFAQTAAHSGRSESSKASAAPDRYARELGLLDPGGVTGAGRVFLGLRGRDAIRWLIACELALAVGRHDPWRCGTGLARWLLKTKRRYWWDCGDKRDQPTFDWETIRRWDQLGLVILENDEAAEMSGFQLTALGKSILQKLLKAEGSAVLQLAEALLADTSAAALASVGAAGDRAAVDTVAHATAKQARMIAHEIRNKCAAISDAIELLRSNPANVNITSTALTVASGAVGDLFDFADRTVELSSSLQGPHDWLDLGDILSDGIAQGRNGRQNTDIRLQGDVPKIEVRSPRHELVMAIGNLIRNALQAQGKQPGKVELRIERPPPDSDGPWRLLVDDDGPGVPVERRLRVFDDGQSFRAGGSGYGLAQLRQLIEGTLGGRVSCDEAPLGGARFALEFPAAWVREVPMTHVVEVKREDSAGR